MKEVKVRVGLSSGIMRNPQFVTKWCSNKSGGFYTDHFLSGLPIEFYDGQFSISTFNGRVPEVLEEFQCGQYSIRGGYQDGSRQAGMYSDEKFADAEAEVKLSGMNKPGGSDGYYVNVNGSNLEHVLGLYWAILNGELLPVSFDKPAVQLISELEQELAGCKTRIRDLSSNLGAAINEAYKYTREIKLLTNKLDDSELVVEVWKAMYEGLEERLAKNKPLHQKLISWLKGLRVWSR